MAEKKKNDQSKGPELAELTEEETRCITMLRKYYELNESTLTEDAAHKKAWADIQREFPRLEAFTWYKPYDRSN